MSKPQVQLKKNDYIDVIFEDLTHDGNGVAKVDGYPLFVANGLPGEKAKIKITKLNKGYGFGRLIELYEESSFRVEPPCPIYSQCGGCQLQHLSYEGQLKAKEKQVRDVLERIGKLEDVQVHPVLGVENPWRYRNKAQVPIGEREGGLIGGFYQQRSHNIIDMDECLIQIEQNDLVLQKVKEICSKYGVRAYNEKTNKGTLRHVMARYGKSTGEIMVVMITRTQDIPNQKKIIEEISQAIPGIKSIVQNVNPKRTNVIFGEQTRVLWAKRSFMILLATLNLPFPQDPFIR